MTENIIITAVILCIICAAGIYVARKRKKGGGCAGCPCCGSCNSKKCGKQ